MDPELLDAWLPGRVTGLFTTRSGGISHPPWDALNLAAHVGDDPKAVTANRARIATALGVPAVVWVEQVHGASVHVIDAAAAGGSTRHGPVGADGIVTNQPGTAIGVLVADCPPVLLSDADGGIVGVAHAGRRGLAAGILGNTVSAMTALGAVASAVVAVIGPAICGGCYEVPAEMRDDIDRLVPGSGCLTRAGTPGLDLSAGAEHQLRALGVGDVRRTGICTREDERFFSHRRDGVTGRSAGVVVFTAEPHR